MGIGKFKKANTKGLSSKTMKNLKPGRVTPQLRKSIKPEGMKEKEPERRSGVSDIEMVNEIYKKYSNDLDTGFLAYLKFLSADNLITNMHSVPARKEALTKLFDIRFDHEQLTIFLAEIWNLPLKVIKGYAKEYYEKWGDRLPYSKSMIAQQSLKEYNVLIEKAVEKNDLQCAGLLIHKRNELLGISQSDLWPKGEGGSGEDNTNKVVVYLPDNGRGTTVEVKKQQEEQ